MEPIQILSIFSAPTEGFWNEPSPQDAERLLSEPLLASPNPSMLTNEWMPSCSQMTHDSDPVDCFDNPKCTGTPLGAFASFTPLNDGADTQFTFDDENVPSLEEEIRYPTINIGGKLTPSKRARCQNKLEAMKGQRTTARRNKPPPKKDKNKMKEYAETMERSEYIPNHPTEITERKLSGTMKALGWCKCKHSRCLQLYCDCFRNGQPCGLECKCKKCQNTDHGNSSEGAATKARAMILERREDAFEARVVKVGEGCACKKNRCLKKYCACVADGLSCDSDRCSCRDCHNTVAVKMQMEVTDSNETVTDSFDESFMITAKDEKADITDSTLDEPSPPPDYDETSLFTNEEVLPAASPDSFPIAEV